MCYCVIVCQHSTLNRLFGFVFLVWRHYLLKVNKSSVPTFRRFFCTILFFYVPQYSNRLIIFQTYDQQFTLTTKKSLHIIVKHKSKIFQQFNSVSYIITRPKLLLSNCTCKYGNKSSRERKVPGTKNLCAEHLSMFQELLARGRAKERGRRGQ